MLHPKSIHYPSGYPISRSPPVFVCASPGPDPYRSLDNVYEELGPRDSDIESEPRINSDDDFAEDELSLNGGAAYHSQDTALATAQSTIPMATSTSTCAAISQTIPSISSIYNECVNGNGSNSCAAIGGDNNNGDTSQLNGNANDAERIDRNSLLSSSSSSTSTAPVIDCVAGRNSSSSSAPTRVASPDSGLAVRNRCKRPRNGKGQQPIGNDMPVSNGSVDDTSSESNHLMNQQQQPQQHYLNQHHHHNQYRNNNNNNHTELSHSNSNTSSLSVHLNNVNNNVNRSGSSAGMSNGNQSIDVARHNQINKQLSATEHPLIPKFGSNRLPGPSNSYQNQMTHGAHGEQMVSTIFPGRLINANSNTNSYNRHQMHNQYYAPCDSVRNGNGSSRSRTNPRSRHRNPPNAVSYAYQNDNTYSYAEPIFREDLLESCAPPVMAGYRTISTSNRHQYDEHQHGAPYVVPSYPDYNDRFAHPRSRPMPSTSVALNEMGRIQPIYSHDSSFGSDSGYSQYTHNSRSKSDGSNSAHSGSSNGNGTLSNMFSWARRKNQPHQQSVHRANSQVNGVRNS